MKSLIDAWLIRIIYRNQLARYFLTYGLSLYKALLSFRYSAMYCFKCYIDSSARIIGWKNISLGDNCVISKNVLINVNKRKSKEKSVLIGNNAVIGTGAVILVGSSVIIREYAIIGPNCSIIGSSHIMSDPSLPYILSGVFAEKNIYIGVNCSLGANVIVRGHVTIGCGSVIGAGSVVNKEIPPFSLAFGNPAKVIKTFCFDKNDWVDGVSRLVCSQPTEEEYLKLLQSKHRFFAQPISVYKSGYGDI